MEQAPPQVREIYAEMLRGSSGAVRRLLTDSPELLRSFLEFYGTVGQSLPRRLYELVYIRIAALNHCHS